MIKDIVEDCSICKRNARSRLKPALTLIRASDFNSVVTLDLKDIRKVYVLHALYISRDIVSA